MAFAGSEPVISKTVLKCSVLEQTKHFKYLDCGISYDYSHYIISVTSLLAFAKETQLKFYKTLSVLVLSQQEKTWKQNPKRRNDVLEKDKKMLKKKPYKKRNSQKKAWNIQCKQKNKNI